MAKVVFNAGYGGFGLSKEVRQRIADRKGIHEKELDWDDDILRHDPDLVAVIEELLENNCCVGDLALEDIGDAKRYWIEEYDGWERVHTDVTEEPWVYINEKEKQK